MGFKQLLLVSSPTVVHLDCMGQLVLAKDICLRTKSPLDPPLIRAFIDGAKKKVICQMGSNAILTISCASESERRNCLQPNKYCGELKEKFANELELTHFSQKLESRNQLTCFYSQKLSEKLINSPLNL